MQNPAYIYSVQLLSRYPKTTNELQKKLEEKWFSPEEISKAITTLQTQNAINDTAYAALYIHSKCKRGKSPYRVKQKLLQKGVAVDIITDILDQEDNDRSEDQAQAVRKLIQQRQRKEYTPQEIFKKLYSKGFSSDQIKKFINE